MHPYLAKFTRVTAGAVADVGGRMIPGEFAKLISIILGQVCASMPDRYWADLMTDARKRVPCGKTGCECHKNTAVLCEAMDTIRKAVIANIPRDCPDEVQEAEDNRAKPWFNHVAGLYECGRQHCASCGGILCDDRGPMGVTPDEHGQYPAGYETGANVHVTAQGDARFTQPGRNPEFPGCLDGLEDL